MEKVKKHSDTATYPVDLLRIAFKHCVIGRWLEFEVKSSPVSSASLSSSSVIATGIRVASSENPDDFIAIYPFLRSLTGSREIEWTFSSSSESSLIEDTPEDKTLKLVAPSRNKSFDKEKETNLCTSIQQKLLINDTENSIAGKELAVSSPLIPLNRTVKNSSFFSQNSTASASILTNSSFSIYM